MEQVVEGTVSWSKKALPFLAVLLLSYLVVCCRTS